MLKKTIDIEWVYGNLYPVRAIPTNTEADIMTTRLGSALHADDRDYVLRAYVHRYTREHVPAWAIASKAPIQFEGDDEWLHNTRFTVRADRRLDARYKACQSSPTWPDNPELRRRTA